MEKRIDREIEAKEELLIDLEKPVDLKSEQLSHHKSTLVTIKDYSLQYKDAAHPVFSNLNQSVFFAILRLHDFERVQFVKDMEHFSEGQKKKVLPTVDVFSIFFLTFFMCSDNCIAVCIYCNVSLPCLNIPVFTFPVYFCLCILYFLSTPVYYILHFYR